MADTYHGKPCTVCCGTERRRSNSCCVRHDRKDHLEARGYLDQKRAQERRWQLSHPEEYHASVRRYNRATGNLQRTIQRRAKRLGELGVTV